MNDNTDGALVAGQRVSGPYPSSIRYYIPLNGLLTKYIADAASYTAIGSGALYMVLMGPMLLPMQITLSLWKEGLHILTIKISNKFFSFKTLSRLFWGALQSLDIIKNCSKPLNDRCGAADGS